LEWKRVVLTNEGRTKKKKKGKGRGKKKTKYLYTAWNQTISREQY